MLWSFHLPPMFFWQCCLFREAKLPCPKGRITNVKVCLEPKWPCSPAVHGQPALCPCPPALPWAVESPWSVQLFSNACTDEFLTAPTGLSWYFGSLGFLDHYCFVLMCCTMVCSGSRASQALWELVKCLFQNQSNPNLLYCRLKSCNPRLRARTAVSVCQWLLSHAPGSLQTLRLICTHSLAACQQVLHFQPWKYIQKIGFLNLIFLIYCSQQHMLS